MRSFSVFLRSGLAALAAGCSGDLPSGVIATEASLARAPTSSSYTSLNVGALLGPYSSRVNGVNNNGDLAGSMCCTSSGAFVRVNGVITTLGTARANAFGISNGTPVHVVGFDGETSTPVLWTIGSSIQATALEVAVAEPWGAARGVNDAGESVGSTGNNAAMWSPTGTLTILPMPAGFSRGEGRGINNAGHAVFVFFAPGSEWAGARGYVRLASGNLVVLPPAAGDVTTFANDLSEVTNGSFYVAGTTRTSDFVFRGVRWTIDAVSGAIVATQIRSEMSHALAAADAGAVAGFLETNAARTARFNAYLWRGTELLLLNPPKGGKDGIAWTASPNAGFVAGQAIVNGAPRAVLWTISP